MGEGLTQSFFEFPEAFAATAAKILLSEGKYKAANILAASTFEISDSLSYARRYQDGFDSEYCVHNCNLILNVNSDIYSQVSEELGEIEREIFGAIHKTLRGRDFNTLDHEFYLNEVIISVLNLNNDNWRSEIKKALSLESVSNQGRVRSDNIAPHEHKGLLFRSPPEIQLFDALTRKGMLFAPLPTFIRNDLGNRIEPDFIVFKDGISLLIEVDGRSYHRESPVDAQNRLNAFTAQGVESFRVDAGRLNSASDADSVVKEIEDFIERRRNLRR